jgi:hypothetical protein
VRLIVAVLWLAGCGRIAFDDRTAGSGDGGTGDGSFTGGMLTYLKASNTEMGDTFGHSVSLSAAGNVLVVGAEREDGSGNAVDADQTDNLAMDSGAVYVFERTPSRWVQTAYLKPSNTDSLDHFGWRVAISGDGNTIAVGAPGEASNAVGIDGAQGNDSLPSAGAVYVFTRAANTWVQQAYIKASNTGEADELGFVVDLSFDGNTLAVSANHEASAVATNPLDDTAPDAGAVYVFTRSGTQWSEQAYLKASNVGAADQFGFSMSLSDSGDTLAVGALKEDGGATVINGDNNDNVSDAGAAYVFQRSGTTWTQQAYVKPSTNMILAEFGYSVVLAPDGNTLVVGATEETAPQPRHGHAYVFTRANSTWSEQAVLSSPSPDVEDHFGWGLALDGDASTLVVTATYEDGGDNGVGGNPANNDVRDAGALYVFERSGTTWAHRTYVKGLAPAITDLFGYAVAISADSTRIVSATFFDDGIPGDPATKTSVNSGAVYVFE